MMRGTPGMRWAMAILSPIFLLLCVVAIHSEETRPWMAYQEQFRELYTSVARTKLEEARSKGDADEQGRWQRVLDELSQFKPEIAQVYLDDLKIADRCTTCHKGIDNPLFADAPQPFRTHPGELLKSHDPNSFGCTLCHQGQGAATEVDAAHGREENWSKPMFPAAYVQTSCAQCHEVTHGVAGAEQISRGADLFMEKGCYGCHDVKGLDYLPKYSPPLTALKSKLLDPAPWVYAWIKDPPSVSPDTAMPHFKLEDEEAGKITAFLLTLASDKRYEPVQLAGASADEGKRLFDERGCRGCHATEADDHSSSPRVPHLNGIGSKVKPEWLDRWLADPKQYNPDAAMPKIELTDEERRHVVQYLLGLKRTDPVPPPPDLSRFSAEDGKQLVKRYECFGCHSIEGFEQTRPAVPDLAEFARRPVHELDFGNTTDVPHTKWDWLDRKLRDPHAYVTDQVQLYMPLTPVSGEERNALIAFCLAFDTSPLPARYAVRASDAKRRLRQVSWMTAHLNCNGCHPLNQKEPRIAKFLERKTLVPPILDGVGARLQGQYLYDFLMEPKQVRPWFKMRMPVFGFTEAHGQALVAGFAAAADVTNPYTYVAKQNLDKEHFDRGIRRFMHYKCMQCHPTSIDQGLPEGLDPDDLSINLMLSKTRLRPEWLRDFMTRPKEIAGMDTRMPTVFYTVDGAPKVERPQDDINDITIYLMGITEPPEQTLAARQEELKAEAAERQIDWSQYEY